jgi:hypothetical protein
LVQDIVLERPEDDGSSCHILAEVQVKRPHRHVIEVSPAGYRRYSRDTLKEAVNSCKSWKEVCRYFKRKPTSGSLSYIKQRVQFFEIESSHLDLNNSYSKESLEEAVRNSKTWAEVCHFFNIDPSNGTQSYLIQRAKEWGIKHDHFRGKGWAGIGGNLTPRNTPRDPQSQLETGLFPTKKTIQDYLVLEGPKISNATLKRLLVESGLKKDECEWCGLTEWLGMKISIELDHIDQNQRDLRIENLQLLCPNCHSMKTANDVYFRPLPGGFTKRGPAHNVTR